MHAPRKQSPPAEGGATASAAAAAAATADTPRWAPTARYCPSGAVVMAASKLSCSNHNSYITRVSWKQRQQG
eukprot:279243-Pelagomonas_calceolata.AAC.1